MSVPLDIREFSKFFRHFSRSAFRLETLDSYSVPEEAESYRRFLDGQTPPVSNNEEWCQLIRENFDAGKAMERVHLVSSPLTPYLRFEIDWGYVHSSAAGERIHLLDRTKVSAEIASMKDFWLFDDSILVLMHYDENGSFVGVERENEPRVIAAHVRARALLLSISVPFEQRVAKDRIA
jgi:hypothetical protein